jgi:hypothetical protein
MGRTIVLICALAAASTARADDLDQVAAGAAASARGDHVTAAQLYLDAYAHTLDPATLVLIGTEYLRADRPDDARRFFCRYPGGDDALFVQAQLATLGSCTAPPAPRTSHLPLVLAAAGAVTLGAGFFEQHRAAQASQMIESHSPGTPWPDNILATERAGQRHELLGNVLLTVGTSALVTGAVVYLIQHRHHRERLVTSP